MCVPEMAVVALFEATREWPRGCKERAPRGLAVVIFDAEGRDMETFGQGDSCHGLYRYALNSKDATLVSVAVVQIVVISVPILLSGASSAVQPQ